MIMSKQAIFNKVAIHLITQGVASKAKIGDHPGINCAYRGEGGLKCAVGIFIPDDKYDPKMEDATPNGKITGSTSADNCKLLQMAIYPELGFESLEEYKVSEIPAFLKDLQLIHDLTDVSHWKEKLTGFAKTHNLEIPEELK